jgi:hypothetical protein
MGLPTQGWMPEADTTPDAARLQHFVEPGCQIAPDVGSITYLARCGALCRPDTEVDPAEPNVGEARCPICASASR